MIKIKISMTYIDIIFMVKISMTYIDNIHDKNKNVHDRNG